MSSKYMTIKKAANQLGVTTTTLRNWDKKGKLKCYRHPINGYRLYKKDQIDSILKNIKK